MREREGGSELRVLFLLISLFPVFFLLDGFGIIWHMVWGVFEWQIAEVLSANSCVLFS